MLTALMIIAIALGIGVSMTILTVNYMMSKDPIPEKSSRLFHVQLYSYGPRDSGRSSDQYPYQMTYQDTMNIHRSDIPTKKTRSLATGFSVIPDSTDLTPFMEPARAIDSDFFEMFNISFIFGKAWDREIDTKPQNLVVIAKELNEKLFKGENSVGKQLSFGKNVFTIIGVTDKWQPAPRYYDLNNGHFKKSELIFIPFSLLPVLEIESWGNNNGWKTETINTYQDKLKSEILWNQYWVELNSPEQIEDYKSWLEGYVSEQKKLGRYEHEKAGATFKNVLQWLDYTGVVSSDNSILVGLSFMFLLVCMINMLGLLLTKFLRRAPEVGVRRALGASRKSIFIQHLVDVGLIGIAGGIAGLGLGQLGLLGIEKLYSNYNQLVQMDMTLVLIAVALALGSSVIAGIYPAWLICRTSPSIYLKSQ